MSSIGCVSDVQVMQVASQKSSNSRASDWFVPVVILTYLSVAVAGLYTRWHLLTGTEYIVSNVCGSPNWHSLHSVHHTTATVSHGYGVPHG